MQTAQKTFNNVACNIYDRFPEEMFYSNNYDKLYNLIKCLVCQAIDFWWNDYSIPDFIYNNFNFRPFWCYQNQLIGNIVHVKLSLFCNCER